MKVLCIFHQRKTLSFKSVRLVSISKDGFTYFLEKNLFFSCLQAVIKTSTYNSILKDFIVFILLSIFVR